VCLVVVVGCSQEKKALSEIETAYREADYRETVALCRHAIRRNVADARVYYYYGASLLAMNRDFEGFKEFDHAVELDPDLRPEAGALVFEAALKDLDGGPGSRGARRLRQAMELDPALDPGKHRFRVADEYFDAKEFERAVVLYRDAVEQYPGDPAGEHAYFNMAVAYAEMGAYSEARQALEDLLANYRRSRYRSQARFKLASLTYDQADKQYVLGNYDDAVEKLMAVLDMTSNRGLQQKTRFLLGETYEAQGEFDLAYMQYKLVIDEDRGASGRIVQRAREKMAAFQEAGLH
jgi:tetratricopeptide (TPR) repeat protein